MVPEERGNGGGDAEKIGKSQEKVVSGKLMYSEPKMILFIQWG
jgi:hypothetical protein